MIRTVAALFALPLLAAPSCAQEVPAPSAIVDDAPAGEWLAIAPDDLLVMDLAPPPDGEARRVVIQLISPPFSQGWVDNIRVLAKAHWWDGTSVNRVQDNYVAQWGDATEKKPLPAGLKVMREESYTLSLKTKPSFPVAQSLGRSMTARQAAAGIDPPPRANGQGLTEDGQRSLPTDSYAEASGFALGWPIAMGSSQVDAVWPVHCYATVGVGRNLSPDTGSGAELYTVIGHAPRHLDRNIAVVGRVVEGIEHLSSLPRGKGDLGFYTDPAKRVSITSVRLASELPAAERPRFEVMNTEGEAFARYADARANRRDPFFIVPAGSADICNIPVPVRRVAKWAAADRADAFPRPAPATRLHPMTRIGIMGASGRMGQAVARAIATSAADLAGGADRAGTGGIIGGLPIGDDVGALAAVSDVLVDFSAPAGMAAHLDAAVAAGVPILIGTTGLRPDDHRAIDRAAAAVPVLQTGNTSLGVTLLARLVREAARRLPDWDIEIVEAHHRVKVDAPSGTAQLLGQAAAAGRGEELGSLAEEGRAGLDCARTDGGIGFASVRGGTVVGDHTVHLLGEGERIELTHRAEDRAIFAAGAVKVALWLTRQEPGRYTMGDMLDL